ncbi:hypothetical protein JW711_03645 [Candidatus Woesearchaeota archaeon]|nr:hypothetical protein [Candidatus Woesearchaeota archaeon]
MNIKYNIKYIYFTVITLIFLGGCSASTSTAYYKGIESAGPLETCAEYQDDACGLFSCMVDMCWCDDSRSKPILYEKENTIISNEEQAVAYVQEYLKLEDKSETLAKSAVKINNVFYNVFTEDTTGYEEAFTLAVDGTILRTTCGV